MNQTENLIFACSALAMLTIGVGVRLYFTRIKEMRTRRIHPQSVALSPQRTEKLQDTRASDNYNHLFELPVLFYALCALAVAAQHIPVWLPITAWIFVALRAIHSIIQCSYNKVMHRFLVFITGFLLLGVMWISFAISYGVS